MKTIDISNKIIEIENHIDKKELGSAQNKFQHLNIALGKLPENEKSKYNHAIQRIFNSIKYLEDWKNYVNDEKRKELTQRMKHLINNDSNPLVKSEIIYTLQNEWKALGHCPNQELWKQFKIYADEAYLPCQEYFNKQKQIRSFNAEQRKIICTKLEEFIESQDWVSPDWKSLDKISHSILAEWNKYTPVDRKDHHALQDRFFKNCSLLKNHINEERKRNSEKLKNIIKQAEILMDATDPHKAIDDYSKLQNEWKSIGITFQKTQHGQWQAFKNAGDALYKKRQDFRQAADHERVNNLNMAESVCKEIITLSSLSDIDLSNSKPSFEKLKSDFKCLGPLPKESFKSVMQNFHNACDIYEKSFKNINKRQWQQQFEKLISLGEEWLTQELNHTNFSPDLRSTGLPEKWFKRLESRFKSETTINPEEHARTLCIEIEVLAGIETPPEDSSLKMKWQLSTLAKHFGQLQSQSENDKLEDLYLRWFAQKCWSEKSYNELQKRFLNAAQSIVRK